MDDGPPVDARLGSGMLALALVEGSVDDLKLAVLELAERLSDNEAFPDGAADDNTSDESWD